MNIKDKVLIFDFDGVIADTYQLHADFLMGILSQQRIQFSLDKSCQVEQTYSHYPLKRQLEKVFYFFLTKFAQSYHTSLVYDPVVKSIEKNTNRKFLLSLGSKRYIKSILPKHIRSHFETIYGRFQIKGDKEYGIKKLFKRYDLGHHNTIFITDTVKDVVHFQKFNNLEVYAVDWGYCPREKLRAVLDESHILSMDQFVDFMAT